MGDMRTTRPTVTASCEVDAAVLARVANGERAALALFYDRFAPRIYSLARRICRAEGLTEDVAQEVFLTVWGTAGRFDPARGPVATWVLAITHHIAVDAVRREATMRRHIRLFDDHDEHVVVPAAGADERAIGFVVASHVRGALAALPVGQRETLVLAYYGGYTQSEIAVILGVPLGTVKSRTFAAMQRLQPELADLHDSADLHSRAPRWGPGRGGARRRDLG